MRPIAAVMMIFGAMLLPAVRSIAAPLASTTDHSCRLEKTQGFQVLYCGRGWLSDLYKTPSIEHCNLTEVNGYLHYMCGYTSDSEILYKCPNSDDLYTIAKMEDQTCSRTASLLDYFAANRDRRFSIRCPNDPGYYQACGHGGCSGYRENFGHEEQTLLCGVYVCSHGDIRSHGCGLVQSKHHQYNAKGGSEDDKRRWESIKCDNVCDEINCADESDCNGVQYGRWIQDNYGKRYWYYRSTFNMCTIYNTSPGARACHIYTDEDTTCMSGYIRKFRMPDRRIRVLDNMRCGVLDEPDFYEQTAPCVNGEDQTNCTDPERISMQCFSNYGHPTNISIFGHCRGFKLCDDDYNNVCVEIERNCTIHKAQVCDGRKDCRFGTDEDSRKCGDGLMTSFFRCKRRFSLEATRRPLLPLPLAWAMDGEIDCLNGEDEDEGWWVKCGNGSNSRFYELGTNCSEVSAPAIRDCAVEGVEAKIIDTSIKLDDQHYLPNCNSDDVETQLGDCQKLEHTAGIVKTVLDIQPPLWINLPRKKIDCSFLYGENYVYAACNDLCFNAICPLPKVAGAICKNKETVLALADTSPPELVMLIKTEDSPGSYENKIFLCNNNNCVLYKDVCNLRDDCGDGSDEANCTNLCPADNIVTVLSDIWTSAGNIWDSFWSAVNF